MDWDAEIFVRYPDGVVSACETSNMCRRMLQYNTGFLLTMIYHTEICSAFLYYYYSCFASLSLNWSWQFAWALGTCNARTDGFSVINSIDLASTVILHFMEFLCRFLITAHATERAPVQTWGNGFILSILIVAKLPEMQGVRLFGMNK